MANEKIQKTDKILEQIKFNEFQQNNEFEKEIKFSTPMPFIKKTKDSNDFAYSINIELRILEEYQENSERLI